MMENDKEKLLADLVQHTKRPQMHEYEHPVFVRSIYDAKANPGHFVEIGVNKGKSTACILQALNLLGERRKLYSIDPSDMAMAFYPQRVLSFAGTLATQFFNTCSQEPATVQAVPKGIAWLFIDGCHCFECVWSDCDLWIPRVRVGGIVVFHDFFMSRNYRKRDICLRAYVGKQMTPIVRRWGVYPAFVASAATKSLEELYRSDKRTGGTVVFRKVK